MNKDLAADRLRWILFLLLAATIAFFLLYRDSQRNFGALGYGPFPEFSLPTKNNIVLNEHLMKGHVWAVHASSVPKDFISTFQSLCQIGQQTASGKRHLYVLSITDNPAFHTQPLAESHYVALASSRVKDAIFQKVGKVNNDTVFLVDQNGIVRGRYDISDVDQLRDFKRNLLRIL